MWVYLTLKNMEADMVVKVSCECGSCVEIKPTTVGNVAWFRRELKAENFDIVGKTNADEVEDLDEVEITEIEIRCNNCGKMIILNM